MTFPKIIWQTHNYKQDWLPTHLTQIGNTWKNLNPGWDYRYMDQVQREDIVKQYPDIFEFYKYQLPAYQSDIWRFLITYEYGGCYADMDSICTMPLDYLIETIGGDPEMITVPEKEGMGNTHNYIVKPKSPILHYVINNMIPSQAKGEQGGLAPFNTFVTTAYSYPNVSKEFTAALHGEGYKNKTYSPNHMINYYGNKIKYLDFLEKNDLSL